MAPGLRAGGMNRRETRVTPTATGRAYPTSQGNHQQ
jgi:hypothetical protein